jgi:hypothetical protein
MRCFIVLALLCSGCIAASLKGRAGVVADRESVGVQVAVSGAIGYAGKSSAVIESIGFATGTAPKAGADIGLDYVKLPRSSLPLGWRAGFGGVPIAYGGPALFGGRAAALYILRDRTRSGGHEKSFSESTRTVRALGVEALAGPSIHDMFTDDARTRFGGSFSVTYEMYMLSRMW